MRIDLSPLFDGRKSTMEVEYSYTPDDKGVLLPDEIKLREPIHVRCIVTDKNGNRIEVTAKGDGKYTFKMPAGQVSVNAKFVRESIYNSCPKDETCPIHGYPDASAAAWYHDGVHYCIENDLMIGVPGDLFAPEGVSTRAQIVTVLWRLEGEPVAETAEGFNDVFEGEWYYNAIRWAAENGIVEGYEGYFYPHNECYECRGQNL